MADSACRRRMIRDHSARGWTGEVQLDARPVNLVVHAEAGYASSTDSQISTFSNVPVLSMLELPSTMIRAVLAL